jgi:hypothetical protein
MLKTRQPTLLLFVDRSSQQWIIRDNDGEFWTIPVADQPWPLRQPFTPTPETELEPVPGHYKTLLGLPF